MSELDAQEQLGFGVEIERARRQPPIEFPLLDPEKMHTDYECPYCGYGWNGRPNARALGGNVHLRSALSARLHEVGLEGSIPASEILSLLEKDVSTS